MNNEMTDKEFADEVIELCRKQRILINKIDEIARISLIIEKNFDKLFFNYIEENKEKSVITFDRSLLYDGPCNYELRRLVETDAILSTLDRKGYFYDSEESGSDRIVLKKYQMEED